MVSGARCRRDNEHSAAALFTVLLQQTGSREDALEAVCGWFLSEGLTARFTRSVFGREITQVTAGLHARCGPDWQEQYPCVARAARRLGLGA